MNIGMELRSRGRTITESDLVGFSTLTGDWHPQHGDAEWASESAFGERIAHGMLILSYSVGLVPFDPDHVVALRGLSKVSFKRPVRIGDTISVAAKVELISPLDDERSLVGFDWRVRNQADELAVRAKVEVLWRDGAAANPGEPVVEAPRESELFELYGDRVLL
jgi:3-hydroxybutyryl-CoA dehydratase